MTPIHRSVRTSLVLAFLALSPFASSTLAQERIRWKSTTLSQSTKKVARPSRTEVRQRLEAVLAQPDGHHVLVRFDRPLTPHAKRRLAGAGVRLLSPVGANAYFASISQADYAPGTVLMTHELVDVQEVDPAWKTTFEYARGIVPEWAVVGMDGGEEQVAAYVLFHPDVSLSDRALDVVGELGGRALDFLESINGLVVELPRSQLGELVRADEVQWVEPPLPRMGEVNDSNRSASQADLVQAAPYNLDGSGVSVLVYDAGTARASHVDFSGRLTSRDASGVIDHATHVAGTVGGDGSASGGTFMGMAPGVDVESYGFQYDGTSIFLYTNPGDLESDYTQAINSFGVDMANNSIGTNTETNGFPCNIQGDYGVTASLIDAIVGGSLGQPFPILWANGNERQGTRCNVEGFGDYYSTAPPATAKNHIAVGAINSNNDSMTSFSSWGPTDDGRIKPDISTAGCQSNGDFGVTSAGAASNTALVTFCGTSMAAPTATGCCALLLEDYRAQFGGADPRNSTLKALLAHSAVDRGSTGPDYQFGYGAIRIRDTIDHMRTGNFAEDTIESQGASFYYTVNVGAGQDLKVTLAWDDVAGTPNVLGSLVNDLDLRVFDPLGNRHYPWVLDPSTPGAAAVQSQADHLNNIEQVFVASATTGVWTVEVHGFDVPVGPQVYSIASSHSLSVGSFLHLGFVNELPTQLTPGVSTTVTAHVLGINDTVVPASPTLHVRYAGGSFLALPMTSLGADLYQVDLPPAICTATPEFYFSAQGTTSGTTTNPPDAPTTFFQADVETTSMVFADDFQTNQGWSVQNVSLTDGAWQRGNPAGDGGRNDPLDDFDGSGQCYLTDNVAGNSDVDGGPTRLISPTFNLASATDPVIHYARWMANDTFDDTFEAQISSNGGSSWTTVETIGNTSGWAPYSFRVADFITPTNNVVVRFNVTDNPNNSITEAALDDFRIVDTDCTATLDDCNSNGIVDSDDIASGRSLDTNTNGIPDECDADCDMDGIPDSEEEDCNNNGTPDDCETFTDCNSNDIPDECEPDCDNDGIPDDCEPDCDIDGIPDDCEVDCNNNGTPDDCETFTDCNSNGIPDECEADCDSDGIPDDCEVDCNNNGTPDDCESFTDCNSNGIPDECEPDCDNDGIPDDCEDDCNNNGTPDDCESFTDCNSNGIPDDCEPDCDNDGIPDDCEVDCNNNGTPDDCESFTDCNSNGIPDECEPDCDNDGIPDDCEVDCNNNGTPDDCESFTDCNSNGIPDECEPDCDNDGIPDDCEVDCNNNGTPDDCESFTDCNSNGIPDECEPDCDNDGIPDDCEVDCNNNGTPDDCETFTDCNSNGIPDECEPDCDNDGIPDDCEVDCNNNGTPDDCETFTDCNSNGIPDECEPDCDNDGIPDDCEADCNNNGTPDDCESFTDCNSNGIPDECEPDCDNDGIPDDCEVDCNNNGTPDDCETFTDCNSNGIPDECEPDCDNDGIPDDCEVDCNNNGTPDDCESFTDCNSNGIPDECEPDCDNDGIPDDCEVDCNNNGTPDDCETFEDCNGNGIPDECDPDSDMDGIPDDCEGVDSFALADVPVTGTVTGSHTDTHAGDGLNQSIREVVTGSGAREKSELEHRWSFDLPTAASHTFFVGAHHGHSIDFDDFDFSYSTDGATFFDLVTVAADTGAGSLLSAELPSTLAGPVTVRVMDANRAAGNGWLDTLHVDVLFVRSAGTGTGPPSTPGDPTALALSGSEISLSWPDTSGDETAFEIEESTDGVSFSLLDTVGANVTSYIHTSLPGSSTRHYRVRSSNGNGFSPYSSSTSATTLGGGTTDAVADSEVTVLGSITAGSFANTATNDGVHQTLREQGSGGKPGNRVTALEHQWAYMVTPGSTVTFFAKAHHTGDTRPTSGGQASDAEDFVFAYSEDGINFNDMFAVTKTEDDGSYQSFVLPGGIAGAVFIQVRDTNRTTDSRRRASLHVDHLFIRSE